MINYGRHFIDKADIKSVSKVLTSNNVTQGPFVKNFEKGLSSYFGAKYCMVVNSGTAALHLACKALKIGTNDNIITTPITFISTANSVIFNGANIDLIDIDLNTYCIDLKKLENYLQKSKKKIKAIFFVDYAGNVLDWKKIKFLSKKYNFFTVNDNCHALGSRFKNSKRYACRYADIVTQSYHPVKAITTGEGGSLMTNNRIFYDRVIKLRSHGIIKNNQITLKNGNWFYKINELGYNYRISDINCALGTSQLKKLDKFVKKRRAIAAVYDKNFKDIKFIKTPKIEKDVEHSYHLYVLLINFKRFRITKKQFFERLKKIGINLQVHYIPIHYHNLYQKKLFYKSGSFPNSEKFYNYAVSLPIYFSLKHSQQMMVIRKIKKTLNII